LSLHLVLVEPAGPLNVGSVARLCVNFGIDELRLVAPRCDHLGEEARRMAVHGGPLLRQARVFPSLAAAIADCGRVVASSGRSEGEPLPLHPPGEALGWLLADPGDDGAGGEPRRPAALVFGREDRGLANDELLQAGRLLLIPTAAGHPSLNLSHAVAVVLYELECLRRAPQPPRPADAGPPPAARGDLEATLADACSLLLEAGFLLPHTAAARMAKLRALLQRAQPTAREVALLRGMVCQLRWACRHPAPAGERR
jgi:tRNA/rRNA methyltransferase